MRDAAYILAGTVSFVVLMGISGLQDQSGILAQVLWAAGLVCFPLGMAFYLSIQGSIINKELTASLAEVQTLSAQKQQILADQNILLEQQVTQRTTELNNSLENLKATQAQLIQSEKMASLGELTAGIAHEIQNPLNFVNNFSEVSVELLEEMEAELKLGQTEDAIDIASDVRQNLEKISHHGKRADGIVKGMLQHSRASSGVKEPVDINVLADEYFRLAYHGLRAKDKTFNSELVTNYADHLPLISIIPQDIGRVMLNLFTNALYTVHQKQLGSGPAYKPTVELSIAAKDGQIQIK